MRTILALLLASVLASPPVALSAETGSLEGRVLPLRDSDLITKTVWVGAIPAEVATDGSFRATGIPGGLSKLAIETSEGLFVVATPVAIAPGTARRVQLAFRGRQEGAPPSPEPEKKKKKGGGVWANPWAATGIIVGSAIVLGFAVEELTKSDDEPVSPSGP